MSDEKDKDQQAKLAEELAETAVLPEDFAVDAGAEAVVEDSVEEALAKAGC